MREYPRDMVGYGRTPPHPHWPGDARVALQFVINYEEGGENAVLHGDPASETFLSEIIGALPFEGRRHMSMESIYEYGSRAGFWRLMRLFEERQLPVTMFAVGLFVGTLTRRFGGKVLVVAGCVIGCVAMSMFAFAHSQEWEIYVATAVLGIGFGLAFSAMSANVVSAVPAEQTSVATGMNANIRTIGGSIGAAVMASIVTAKLEPSGLPTEAGYTTGFGVMAAVGTLAMSGDAVTAESAAGETLASELGE